MQMRAMARGGIAGEGVPFYRARVARRVEAGLRWGKDKAGSGECSGEAAIGRRHHWAEEAELRVAFGGDWPWAAHVWGTTLIWAET